MLKPRTMHALFVGCFGLGAMAPRLCAGTVSPWLALTFGLVALVSAFLWQLKSSVELVEVAKPRGGQLPAPLPRQRRS